MSVEVPQFIRSQAYASDLVLVDKRVSLNLLIKVLSDGGLTVINDRTGKLMVTCWPEDFRSTRNDNESTTDIPEKDSASLRG